MFLNKYKTAAGRSAALLLAAVLAAAPLPSPLEAMTAEAAPSKTTEAAEESGKDKTAQKAAPKKTSEKKEEAPAPASPYDSLSAFKPLYTKDGIEDLPAERAANLAQPPSTNMDPAWPQGPSIGAAGAVVMDADSGQVLYAKNMYMHLYPASITKVMTGLLACENLRPTDTITFSENAVFGIERGSSNIGMDVGESITVEEGLYGLMVASANEVAVALGERVSGSETAFVDLMNLRARELGCQNTHFVTTNGLHDPDHYTCAYDMALIAREAFRHPDLVEYMSQGNYHFEASDSQPDDFWIGNTNSFLNGAISCDEVVGGKTGYTDEARETLVSFAEKDGKRLICVIMREEPPYQYYDTMDLLAYAYDSFHQIRVAGEETRFNMQGSAFLSSATDIFGKSEPAFSIDSSATLMLPNNASFSDLTASITPLSYAEAAEEETQETAGTASAGSTEGASENADFDPVTASASDPDKNASEDLTHRTEDGTLILGNIRYQYHDYDLGTVPVLFTPSAASVDSPAANSTEAKGEDRTDLPDVSEAGNTAATLAAPDVPLPAGSTRSSGGPFVPEEVHGIRALFFALVHTGAHDAIYLNILLFLPLLLVVAFLLCVVFWVRSYFADLNRRRNRKRRRAGRMREERPSRRRASGDRTFQSAPGTSGEKISRPRTSEDERRRRR